MNSDLMRKHITFQNGVGQESNTRTRNGMKNTTCKLKFTQRLSFIDSFDAGRADYADDEYIRDLLEWKHPHAGNSESFQYSDEENATILRLPRKECR